MLFSGVSTNGGTALRNVYIPENVEDRMITESLYLFPARRRLPRWLGYFFLGFTSGIGLLIGLAFALAR